MDDYYKVLGIQYDASIVDITNNFNLKIFEYKALPFLTDKDKQSIKNLKKAFFWYEKSALQGNSRAQIQLADFYKNSDEKFRNYKKAISFFPKTAPLLYGFI